MRGRGGKRAGAGRPKGVKNRATVQARATIAEMARRYTPMALKRLAEIAKDGASEAAAVSACSALLDRAWGRPAQSVEVAGPGGGPIPTVDLTRLSDEQIDRLEDILRAAAVSRSDPGREGTPSS